VIDDNLHVESGESFATAPALIVIWSVYFEQCTINSQVGIGKPTNCLEAILQGLPFLFCRWKADFEAVIYDVNDLPDTTGGGRFARTKGCSCVSE
jgi:hypothetical protein